MTQTLVEVQPQVQEVVQTQVVVQTQTQEAIVFRAATDEEFQALTITVPNPAMAETRRDRLYNEWKAKLTEHKNHQSFKAFSDPVRRCIGFRCSCSGEQEEFSISITAFREATQGERERTWKYMQARGRDGQKKIRRAAHLAEVKSKALLHRHLTKEQKWDIRATRSFKTKGKDGHIFEIHLHQCNNVKRLDENGVPDYSFCIISKYSVVSLPLYDLILAQKVLLETDLDYFYRTSVVYDLRGDTGRMYKNGSFLVDPNVNPNDVEYQRVGNVTFTTGGTEETVLYHVPENTVLNPDGSVRIIPRIPYTAIDPQTNYVMEGEENGAVGVGELPNPTLDPESLYVLSENARETDEASGTSGRLLGTPEDEVEGEAFVRTVNTYRKVGRLRPEHLLMTDLMPEERVAIYENDLGIAFVLNENYEVEPVFNTKVLVSFIPDPDVDLAIVRLITGVPSQVYTSLEKVIEHFQAGELPWSQVLMHPDMVDTPLVGPLRKVLDERVPKGEIYCIADCDFTGVVCHHRDNASKGFVAFNPNAVCIYTPPQPS
jgi:hypothetical protein